MAMHPRVQLISIEQSFPVALLAVYLNSHEQTESLHTIQEKNILPVCSC